ncbi:MAG: hypothetical protein JOZ55_08780 [Alphaproteobacteria bacterium]|nr:hypothetical protein [Alphaproteobacteria bacterium]
MAVRVRNPRLRFGHAGGHVRETFGDAVHAFLDWGEGEPEPVVEYQVNYEPHEIPISRACTLVWNCTDIVRGALFDRLRDDAELHMGARTYGACARALLPAIKARASRSRRSSS